MVQSLCSLNKVCLFVAGTEDAPLKKRKKRKYLRDIGPLGGIENFAANFPAAATTQMLDIDLVTVDVYANTQYCKPSPTPPQPVLPLPH